MEITHSKRSAHKDQIICIDVHPTEQHLFCSASVDGQIRLWDSRVFSSIKMFKDNDLIGDEMSSVLFCNESILCSAGQSVFMFDLKTDKVIVAESQLKAKQNYDEINQLALDSNQKILACCDDSGGIGINCAETFEQVHYFKDTHKNISYSCAFGQKSNNTPILISSSFDCTLNFLDFETRTQKQTNIQELSAKHIEGKLLSPPLIYSVFARKQSILVSTETGHVWCFNLKEIKKPKYVISAHLAKVLRSVYAKFHPERIITVGADKNFAIWDQSKRDFEKNPSFLKRIEIENKPNWIETTVDNKILLADLSNELHIYQIKE